MATKKTTAEKTTAKNTTTKKTAVKKAAAEKTTTKASVKKTAEKKAAAVKQDVQKYIDVINWKKGEANGAGQLYIELNAAELNTEVEAGVANLTTVCKALNETMLEGDEFVVASKRACGKLTVRYYCDNLSEDRRKYSEVNA